MRTLGILLVCLVACAGCRHNRTRSERCEETSRIARGTVAAVFVISSYAGSECVLELKESLGTRFYAPNTCVARPGDSVTITYTYDGNRRTATDVVITAYRR